MAEPWTTAAHRLFKKHNIRTVGYVPDAGLTELIKSCDADNDIKSVVMTTEEEGIGLSSGAWLGGEKAAVLMQSSGVGNTVNAIVSLLQLYNFPVIFLISYRGTPGEQVSAQGGMAKITKDVLDIIKIPTLHCSSENDLDKIKTYTDHAKIMESPIAILCDFELMKNDK